ncbi:MAG: ABC transporter permease [Spirochaetota bacterium]|nr:MAG: ABC transporter permease [Spirochaetota bacterium]
MANGRVRKFLTKKLNLSAFPVVGPISIWILLFVLMPLAVIFIISFLGRDIKGSIVPSFSLDNYRLLFSEGSEYAKSILRSILFAFATNAACLIIGYPMAYWIVKYGGKIKPFLLLLVIVPSWSCYVVRIYALKQLIGYPGIINNFLLNIGLVSSPIEILYTPHAVILGLIYIWLPFMVLPIYASLEGIDPSLLEASVDLGATPAERFLTITLPLSKGGIFGGTILTFIPAFGDWIVPLLLGGNKVWMAGTYIAHYFIVMGDLPLGSSMTVFLTTAIVLMIYICIKLGGEQAIERIL